MKITLKHLEKLGACRFDKQLFVKMFPEGATITKKNIEIALPKTISNPYKQLNIWWLLERLEMSADLDQSGGFLETNRRAGAMLYEKRKEICSILKKL